MTVTLNMTLILFLTMDRSGMPSPPGAGRPALPAPQQRSIC